MLAGDTETILVTLDEAQEGAHTRDPERKLCGCGCDSYVPGLDDACYNCRVREAEEHTAAEWLAGMQWDDLTVLDGDRLERGLHLTRSP